MKKHFPLLPLALGALTVALSVQVITTTPGGDASRRSSPAAGPASDTDSTLSCAPASVPDCATASPAPLPGQNRRAARPARPDRAAVSEIIPSLRTPVADWRTFTPAHLTVALVPGMPLDFVATSITTDGKRTTWVGTNAEQGATLVASATETLWDAIITVPGADEYSIQITPESARVIETAHGNAGCGYDALVVNRLLVTASSQTLPAGTTAAAVDTTTLNTADLLVLYSTGAKNTWGSTAEMENRIAAVVATMNTYLEQSRIDNLRWRLVGTAETPAYTTTEKLEDDLERLANPTTELGRFAATQRNFYGADQVMFIVDGTRDYAGIAYLGTTNSPAAFSVVRHPGTAATAAHELGHNFGCRHDRQTSNATDNDGNYYYYYGHRFTYNGQDVGTIMSYADYLAPYFSNPSINYAGIPVGIAADQPKAADNARWLRERAAGVANLRASKATAAPVITAEPASTTVTAGQTISLSVTATGTDLTYQWARESVDLAGATSATYSKSSSTSADAGSYTVLVRNILGSVRSSAATVTVNPAPTPAPNPTPSPSSSSSGGGGGALDLMSALGLLVLLAGAARQRRGMA